MKYLIFLILLNSTVFGNQDTITKNKFPEILILLNKKIEKEEYKENLMKVKRCFENIKKDNDLIFCFNEKEKWID